jgi:two-component system KDP operon response regulator KdpE
VPSILVVEDYAPHRRTLQLGLSARGFEVTAVGDGRAARDAVDSAHHDVVLLDLGLPDIDGIELCRLLHVWPGSPIVVVSGDGNDGRIVAALEVGADDYVVKPVTIDVLVARIGVQLRHATATAGVIKGQVLEAGDVTVDTAAHETCIAGVPVELNAQQFTILTILLRNPGKLVTHEVLARASGYGHPSDRNALRVAVSRLRRRLGDGPDRPEIITEKPVGYRLRVPSHGGAMP